MKTEKWLVPVLILVAFLSLNACTKRADSGRVDEANVRSEKEIASYIKASLEEKYSVSFTLKLASKEPMELSQYTMIDGSAIGYYEVAGAYIYFFEVSDPDGVTVIAKYYDPIIVTDGTNSYPKEEFYVEYNGSCDFLRAYYDTGNNVEAILQKSDVVWKKDEYFCVFVYTDDAEKLGSMISELDSCIASIGDDYTLKGVNVYISGYVLYATKDESFFDRLDSDAVARTTPAGEQDIELSDTSYSATVITHQYGYSADVFEHDGDSEHEWFQWDLL